MFHRLRTLWEWRSLVMTLVGRDLLARYKGSTLGVLWSLMHPLVLAAVYTFAFKFVIQIQIPNYVVFLLAGLLPWLFFASSLGIATTSIVDSGPLVKKVAFPREALPVASVLAQLVHFALAYFVALPIVAGYYGLLRPGYLALPLIMALQILFTTGFAVALSVSQVYLRDTRHLLEVGLQVVFWATPIVYSLQNAPEAMRRTVLVNPLALFMVTYQDLVTANQLPTLSRVSILAACGLGSFFLGYGLFHRAERRIAEYV
ncbi:MAG: ABC transporter permease [Acidobacteria bacterium]|nr:ABC transporter permease [Acidobacteriota bacterium]